MDSNDDFVQFGELPDDENDPILDKYFSDISKLDDRLPESSIDDAKPSELESIEPPTIVPTLSFEEDKNPSPAVNDEEIESNPETPIEENSQLTLFAEDESDQSIDDILEISSEDLQIDYGKRGRWTYSEGAARSQPRSSTSGKNIDYSDDENSTVEQKRPNLSELQSETQRLVRELPKHQPVQYRTLTEFKRALKAESTQEAVSVEPVTAQINSEKPLDDVIAKLKARIQTMQQTKLAVSVPRLSGQTEGYVDLEDSGQSEQPLTESQKLFRRFERHSSKPATLVTPQETAQLQKEIQPSANSSRSHWKEHRQKLQEEMRNKRLTQYENRLDQERRLRNDSKWTFDAAEMPTSNPNNFDDDQDDSDYSAGEEEEGDTSGTSGEDDKVMPNTKKGSKNLNSFLDDEAKSDDDVSEEEEEQTKPPKAVASFVLRKSETDIFLDSCDTSNVPQSSNTSLNTTPYELLFSQKRPPSTHPSVVDSSLSTTTTTFTQKDTLILDSDTVILESSSFDSQNQLHNARKKLFEDESQDQLHAQRKKLFDTQNSQMEHDEEGSSKNFETQKEESEDEPVAVKNRRVVVMSDSEEEDDEENVSGSPEEEETASELDEEEDELALLTRLKEEKKKKNLQMNMFLDEEAELSGSDEERARFGEDEKFDREELEEEYNRLKEELLADDDEEANSERRAHLEKLHWRLEMAEDQRKIRYLKELLFEDGDLHNEDAKERQRRFRWQGLDKNFDKIANFSDNEDADDESDTEDRAAAILQKLEKHKNVENKEKTEEEEKENSEQIQRLSSLLKWSQQVTKRTSFTNRSNFSCQVKSHLAVKMQSRRGSLLGSVLLAKKQAEEKQLQSDENEKRQLNALGLRNKVGQTCFKRLEASEEPLEVVTRCIVPKTSNALKRPTPASTSQPVSKKLKRHSVFAALNI